MGQREDSHPFYMDLVLFQQDFYHLSLSPVSGSVDPRVSPMVEMRLETNRCGLVQEGRTPEAQATQQFHPPYILLPLHPWAA